MTSRSASSLRSITYRLSSASPAQLPHLIQPIATALLDCKSLLSSSSQNSSKDASDATTLHKFKTQITTLLNGKTVEGRLIATALIKTTIELGGWEILQSSGRWVRSLLSNLGKPDPTPIKKLVILTLTRIFLLTQEFPSVIREITTPSLPAFVNACLNLVAPKTAPSTAAQRRAQSELLLTVLESLKLLLPHHPTIFRTYLTQLRPLLLRLAAPTPSFGTAPNTSSFISTGPKVIRAAQSLFVLLPYCSPKAGSSEEWNSTVTSLISEIHETVNKVFRSVVEDWQSIAGILQQNGTSTSSGAAVDVLAQKEMSAIGFPSWSGINAGLERLRGLLQLLDTFVRSPTAATVTFPLGRVIDLLRRISSVTVPPPPPSQTSASGKARGARTTIAEGGLRHNNAVSRDERDALFDSLPAIHGVALSIIASLCGRLGSSMLPVLLTLTEHIAWVFKFESYNDALRRKCFTACSKILEIMGSGMTKEQIKVLESILRRACDDILPEADTDSRSIAISSAYTNGITKQGNKDKKQNSTLNADMILDTTNSTKSSSIPNIIEPTTPLIISARHLLTTALTHLPSQYLSHTLRSTLDRTAILSNDKKAMLASVLNPPRSNAAGARVQSSILPLLAKAFPGDLEVEGLVRPRMPVLVGKGEEVDEDDEEDEENDVQNGGMEWMAEQKNGGPDDAQQDEEDLDADHHGGDLFGRKTASLTKAEMRPATVKPAFGFSKGSSLPKTTTEPSIALAPPVDMSSTLKRSASVTTNSADSKKAKLAADSTSKSLVANDIPEMSRPQPTIIDKPATSKSSAEVATVAVIVNKPATNVAAEVDSDDDSENFEIPELTMEQDTDEDDEEEDVDQEAQQ